MAEMVKLIHGHVNAVDLFNLEFMFLSAGIHIHKTNIYGKFVLEH